MVGDAAGGWDEAGARVSAWMRLVLLMAALHRLFLIYSSDQYVL